MKSLDEIQAFLDERVNALLAQHGGRVEITGIEKDLAYVKLSGGCQGCAGAKYTLKLIVENHIKYVEPAIKTVIDITDHDAGENPYYKKEE